MNQERFHEGMEELKNKYESLPTISSSEEIFRAVKNDQQKRRIKRKINWSPIAATIAFFLISTILLTSIFTSNDEFSQSSQGNNNTNNSLFVNNNENNAVNEQNESNDSEEVQNNENNLPPIAVDRPEEKVIVEWPEGMPEDVTYELYVNENFRFSTYIAPHIQLAITEEENKLHFIAEYLQMEVEMIPSDTAMSYEEIELQIKDKFSNKGFSEYHDSDEKMFQSIDYQGIMLNETEELISFYAILKNDTTGAIYKYHAVMPIIAQEGTFYPAVKRFIDELIFY